MESRFAHYYKRDNSVSMIRVKMSRRRSQTQKENREKMQNLHRHLDNLPELELSLDDSSLEKSVIPIQETGHKAKADKNTSAVDERRNMLARFKERKALQKEKEKREKEKKGTFKVGLYRPQPLGYLPMNPLVQSTKKTTESVPSTRVTRSMKQHLQPKPAEKQPALKKAEPAITRANKSSAPVVARGRVTAAEQVVRAPTTRSAAKIATTAITATFVAKPPAGHTESEATENREMKSNKSTEVANEVVSAVNPSPPKEEKMVDEAYVTPVSFAPQGFVFQPPSGLSAFQPTPLSPRSAEAFLSPNFSVVPQMESTSSVFPPTFSPPPRISEPCPPSTSAPPAITPPSSIEPQHDVPYFRSVMASETERLSALSEFWESRFDDSSIPEEMRDQMRTAVGQARLLMKERFGQFSGLVDDCDFGRGEKITTCTDLQGFWDMVYFQVEDVDKKFNALKEAETRGWQEELKPIIKQKKMVKKPPAVGSKTGTNVGASAAAKNRLAAVKAAMKAKQAAAAKPTVSSDKAQNDSSPAQTVVFHGGFFQVESPIKVAVVRSSQLSTAPFTLCSPRGSKFTTPSRQQRSIAVVHPSPRPCILTKRAPPTVSPPISPVVARTTASPICTSKQHADPSPCSNKPLHSSLEVHTRTPCASPNGVSEAQLGQTDSNTSLNSIQSDLIVTPGDDQMNQSEEIQPLNSPCQSEEPPPLAHSGSSIDPVGNSQESALSQEPTEETVFTEVDLFQSDNQAHAMSFTHSPSASQTIPQAESLETHISVPYAPSVVTTPQQVKVLSPAPVDKLDTCDNERSPISVESNVTENQHSEDVAGLDFERYLQPTPQCSLSPVQSMAVDRFSLSLEDAEMESPQSQAEEQIQVALMTPSAFPGMAPLAVTPWTKEMTASQLLFTPEQSERVRQSLCEHDLMMFTPSDDM